MGRALLVLETPAEREKAISWINKAPVGTRVEFKASKRSLPQNDLMWALLTDIAQQLEHGGRKYDATEWKCIFLHAFGREITFLPSLDNRTFLPIEMSSSDLSKDEMTDFIEFIMKEGTERGVTFHIPKETNSGDQSPPDQPADDATAKEALSNEPSKDSSPDDGSNGEPAGNQPPTAGSPSDHEPIPEKDLPVLRRFAKDVLNRAADPNTSGDLMSKVLRHWLNVDIPKLSEQGQAAARGIAKSVKAIMAGDVSLEPAIEFHAEGLGCEPGDLAEERADG
jgi:hypothetical protein